MAQGIYKRGEGQYLVRIRQNGRNLARTFETHEAAREWREVTVGQVTGQTYVDRTTERRTTLADVLNRYLAEVTPKKKGHRQERARIKAWLAEEWAVLPVISISGSHILEWRGKLEGKGRAPSTIRNALNLLSAVFKQAAGEWQMKVTNPCAGIKRPKQRPPRKAYLSPADEAALIAACEKGPAYLPWMVKLAIETAMRQGEIRRIELKHCHPTHIHLPETKNEEARDVPLTEEAHAVVEAIKRALPRRLDGWMFGHPELPANQGGCTEWQVQQAFADAVRLAMKDHGMKARLTFHDLRHVATTRLYPLHTDAMDLSKTTGHKTISVLAGYYNKEVEARTAEIRARKRNQQLSAVQ